MPAGSPTPSGQTRMSYWGASARKRCSQPFGSQPMIARRMLDIVQYEPGGAAHAAIRYCATTIAPKLLRHGALGRGLQLEGCREQGAGVVALRAREQILGRPLLHHLAVAHDNQTTRQRRHHPQVVRDEQVGEVE